MLVGRGLDDVRRTTEGTTTDRLVEGTDRGVMGVVVVVVSVGPVVEVGVRLLGLRHSFFRHVERVKEGWSAGFTS